MAEAKPKRKRKKTVKKQPTEATLTNALQEAAEGNTDPGERKSCQQCGVMYDANVGVGGCVVSDCPTPSKA